MPQAKLAALFADPQQNAKWMDDLERVESLSGELGMPGSKYRLVPKRGRMVFVATVIARNLPAESHLRLEASSVAVSVKGTFVALSSDRTRLTSEEVFEFRGPLHQIVGFFAQGVVRRVHRRHMEAFKRFAEAQR